MINMLSQVSRLLSLFGALMARCYVPEWQRQALHIPTLERENEKQNQPV
jgi:hypothetical protein